MTNLFTARVTVLFSVICAVLFFGLAYFAHANPSYFPASVSTATATSTLVYMTPGTATTTLTLNSFSAGNTTKTDKAVLAFQYTASGTAPVLQAVIEYSQDGLDWYPAGYKQPDPASGGFASTTQTIFTPITWNLATSTNMQGGSGTLTRIHDSVAIDTQLQWVRVKFIVPVGGGNGGLWAQIIPVKEKF